MKPNSPNDQGILIKAPRTVKKNMKPLFPGALILGLKVCKGVSFMVSKEVLSPNLVLKSMGLFSRYVSRVLVHDLVMDQKWYFLCNSWLSINVGDCVLDKVFPVATEQDRKQFRYFFFFSFKANAVYFVLSSLKKLHHNLVSAK